MDDFWRVVIEEEQGLDWETCDGRPRTHGFGDGNESTTNKEFRGMG